MVIKSEQSPERDIKEIIGKSFANLKAGDREKVVAEITKIKVDEKNNPPQWVLYYLFDGTSTIRAFGKSSSEFDLGDIVMVDLSVRHGKPFSGKPQMSYKIHSMEILKKENFQDPRLMEKLKFRDVLRKSELQTLSDGSRIKLFTKILNLHPLNGEREKYQKVLVADLENKPISLWLRKDNFHLFEALSDEEYFILKATVKITEHSETARFLSFEALQRGAEINKNLVARLFFEERIRYYTQALLTYLDLWKTNIPEPSLGVDLLTLALQNFREEKYKSPIKK